MMGVSVEFSRVPDPHYAKCRMNTALLTRRSHNSAEGYLSDGGAALWCCTVAASVMPPLRPNRRLRGFAFGCIFLAVLGACTGARAVTPDCATAWHAAEVRRPVDAYLKGARLPGVAAQSNNTDVSANFSGRVVAIEVHDGELVTAGAVLVRLESQELNRQAQLLGPDIQVARAEVAQANADLQRLQREQTRRDNYPQLFGAEEREAHAALLAAARAHVDQMNAQAAAVELRRKQNALSQELLLVRAPIDGIVTHIGTRLGATVAASASLVELAPAGAEKVRFAIPVEAASHLRRGDSICILAAGMQTLIAAHVSHVGVAVDAAAQAMIAEAIVDAGMSADLAPGTAVDLIPLPVAEPVQ